MGYAVEMYFDSQTEKSVWDLRQTLFDQGIASTVSSLGDRPHVSLAVFQNANLDHLLYVTKEYANGIKPFHFQLSAVGSFPTSENVLFLSPVLTDQLANCHKDFHDRLAEAKLSVSSYYLPGNWIPHCTVEMNIPDKQLAKAFDLCKKNFKPLDGQFQAIGVTEFRPIKQLARWPFVN